MKYIFLPLLLIMLFIPEQARADKFIGHMITLPLIEGTGAVACLTTVKYSRSAATKTAAFANIGLLALNSGLGLLSFINKDKYKKIRRFHRIIGITIIGAGVWLSLSTSFDKGTKDKYIPYTAYGYTGLSLIPLFMFRF